MIGLTVTITGFAFLDEGLQSVGFPTGKLESISIWLHEGCRIAAVMTYKIAVDTATRRVTLRQLKGPWVTSRIPITTCHEAVDVPIDFHVHCGEMRPAFLAILIAVLGAGSARIIPSRRIIGKGFAVPAIGVVNVVTQACRKCVAIGHGEAQACITIWILLRIWIRTVRRRTRELNWLRDASARVSSQVDSSALQRGGIRLTAPVRIANEHLKAWGEGFDGVRSCHRRAGESARSRGSAMW